VSQQTTNRSFDDLARALAEGSISRRRALKLFAGTALAALIPSRALAEDDDCVRVCHVPFDRETEECDFANAVTRCVSRRERRRHLKKHPCDCGGRCANCLTPACIPDGEPCTEATASQCCSGSCSNNICCPAGRVGLSNGTCAQPCTDGVDECFSCSDNCASAVSGGELCSNSAAFPRIFCSGDSDCPKGQFCRFSGSGDRCDVAC
jgi:hypothetical protein